MYQYGTVVLYSEWEFRNLVCKRVLRETPELLFIPSKILSDTTNRSLTLK